jgi:predicted RNA-binding Zn-ribbon protein involved in translation (DUF1610 family)
MKLVVLIIGVIMLAATITQWYCPKCGSIDVSERLAPSAQPQIHKKSMDEYKGFAMTTTLEYRAKTYELICNKCGYKVEMTQ